MPRRSGSKPRKKKTAHVWTDGVTRDMKQIKVCGRSHCNAQWTPGRPLPGSSCPAR
jgi:hypothetical protein